MATRNDRTNADAVALRGCVRHSVSSFAAWRRVVATSGLGIAPRLSTRYGFMGRCRCPQTRPTTLLRLRFVRLLHLAHHSSCLSLSDPRCAGVFDVTLLCRYLRCCDARSRGGIHHSRVCVMTVLPNNALQRTPGRLLCCRVGIVDPASLSSCR